MTYDVTGRLVGATKGTLQVLSQYNALGQRMTKQTIGGTSPGTRVFIADEAGRPVGAYQVTETSFTTEEEYVHLDGWRPIAVVRPDASTGMNNPKIFPILTDHLGTPRKILDGNSGQTRWSWDAKDAFGNNLPDKNPENLGSFNFELRFPGQREDTETGLFQNGFRDYHPGLGRYVQSDPIGLDAGWNTYAYVNSDPINNTDFLGLKKDYKIYIWGDDDDFVGHVMLTDLNDKVILNQYPGGNWPLLSSVFSSNVTAPFAKPFRHGKPTWVFQINIEDEISFEKEAEKERRKDLWTILPSSDVETNCVVAVNNSLQKTGMNVTRRDFKGLIWMANHPSTLGRYLLKQTLTNSSVKLLEKK